MDNVSVMPMPDKYRTITPRFRPGHPPVFPLRTPTAKDKKLARELFKLGSVKNLSHF
jgi:hypothetical protein